jgi:hypothetical protein
VSILGRIVIATTIGGIPLSQAGSLGGRKKSETDQLFQGKESYTN